MIFSEVIVDETERNFYKRFSLTKYSMSFKKSQELEHTLKRTQREVTYDSKVSKQ